NAGNLPLLGDGSAETRVWVRVFGGDGEPLGPAAATRLPNMVVPGQTLRLPVNVNSPACEGDYLVGIFAGPVSTPAVRRQVEVPHTFPLRVASGGRATDVAAASETVQAALAEADTLAELPAGYTDVSEGLFAEWKSKLKRKLLHQFQVSYVD